MRRSVPRGWKDISSANQIEDTGKAGSEDRRDHARIARRSALKKTRLKRPGVRGHVWVAGVRVRFQFRGVDKRSDRVAREISRYRA
jgi:hypothetical protein